MNKLILVLSLVFVLFLTNKVSAQSYSSGSYYTQTIYISDVCNGCQCKQAVWHQRTGSQWVYIWNGYQWVYVERWGVYYWYTWSLYNRCGY